MCQQPQQRQDQLRQKQVKRLFPGQTLRLQEEAQKETRLEGGSWLAFFFFSLSLFVLYEYGGGWGAWMEAEVSLSVAHLVRMWPPSRCACVGSDRSLASFVTVTGLLHCNCRGTGAELGGIPCPAGAPSASDRPHVCKLWAAGSSGQPCGWRVLQARSRADPCPPLPRGRTQGIPPLPSSPQR